MPITVIGRERSRPPGWRRNLAGVHCCCIGSGCWFIVWVRSAIRCWLLLFSCRVCLASALAFSIIITIFIVSFIFSLYPSEISFIGVICWVDRFLKYDVDIVTCEKKNGVIVTILVLVCRVVYFGRQNFFFLSGLIYWFALFFSDFTEIFSSYICNITKSFLRSSPLNPDIQ